ncbi:MAG: HD domain-containing protein [bacterium]
MTAIRISPAVTGLNQYLKLPAPASGRPTRLVVSLPDSTDVLLVNEGVPVDRLFITKLGKHDYAQRVEKLVEGLDDVGTRLVYKAFYLADAAFRGVIRKSGDPYIEHCVGVAEIVRHDFKLKDAALIAAALLHDVIEDTDVTFEYVARELGLEVADLVDGETKLGHESGEARTRKSSKKQIDAIFRDVRVALLKMADSLHNMQDQQYFSSKKAEQHAKEALIYAGYARMLGMWEIKNRLEALAMKWLFEKEVYEAGLVAYKEAIEKSQGAVDKCVVSLSKKLETAGVKAKVVVANLSFADVAKEAYEHNCSLEELMRTEYFGLNRVRVVVKRKADIKRVADLFVDQDDTPSFERMINLLSGRHSQHRQRPTGYQALHIYDQVEMRGELLISVLTKRMHKRNQQGILFNLRRAERLGEDLKPGGYDWRQTLAGHLHRAYFTSDKKMQDAISDILFPIRVFTPHGEKIEVPRGASVLEVAFAIDRMNDEKGRNKVNKLGLHVAHAMISGRGENAAFDARVENEETIRIVPRADIEPTPTWLSYVRSEYAANKIREHLRSLPEAEQLRLAREAMNKYSERYFTSWAAVKRVSIVRSREFVEYLSAKHELTNCQNVRDLELLIGRGDIDPDLVGDEFNDYYSKKVKQRKDQGKFTPLVVRLHINDDKPGHLRDITAMIAKLNIDVEVNTKKRTDGSADGVFVLSVASSLQIFQIKTIFRRFLRQERVGGGQVAAHQLNRNQRISDRRILQLRNSPMRSFHPSLYEWFRV